MSVVTRNQKLDVKHRSEYESHYRMSLQYALQNEVPSVEGYISEMEKLMSEEIAKKDTGAVQKAPN